MIDKRHFIAYKTYFIGLIVSIFILIIFSFKTNSTTLPEYQEDEIELIENDGFDSFIPEEELEKVLQVNMEGEDFMDFIDQFTSDSNFQLSRVKFPVGDRAYKINKTSVTDNLENDPDFDIFWDDFVRYEDISIDNWVFLQSQYFTETNATDTSYPSGWIYYDNNLVSFLKGFLHSDDFEYMLNFEKIDDKWYLVEYKDGVLWEE